MNICVIESRFGLKKLASAITRGGLTLAVFSALLLIGFQPAQAQTVTLLHSFTGRPGDGATPQAGLVMDKEGNLYGTTTGGGASGWGTVFELTPAGNETMLFSFDFSDGAFPIGGVIMDKKGNLYGTTFNGGTGCWGTGYGGCGIVFKVTPAGTETVLYSFTGSNGDGANPYAGLVMDKKGNLYGTTWEGGAVGAGTVFKLTPTGTETVLYSFGSQSGDGFYPLAGVMMDKENNLYGTTWTGGANREGTVFKVTPSGTETVLYSFGSQSGDGSNPYAGLIMDKKGNLYGTTNQGGANHEGTVFKVTPSGTETVLYSFGSQSGDGYYPFYGSLIMDKKRNLYGTTWQGGGAIDAGTVFKLTPTGTESVLYSFTDTNGDGANPYAGVVMDKLGNVYGTTSYGGASGYGTVFKLTP